MNKTDLATTVAKKVGVPKSQAEATVDAIFTAIGDALKKGDKAAFVGFGTFSVAKRKARVGRNPQTGKEIKIPAKKVVKFSAGKALKQKAK
jgi:DNA-binding protein HU-beta